jgi:hypothetical protein
MNEANHAVREAARDVVVEILGALEVPPQEIESHFGEGSAGAAIELSLTRFAGAILEQAKPRPACQPVEVQLAEDRLDDTQADEATIHAAPVAVRV